MRRGEGGGGGWRCIRKPGSVVGDGDEKEGDEIEIILSLVPVPLVYINKCDQPCSPSLPVSTPAPLQSVQMDCDSCRL